MKNLLCILAIITLILSMSHLSYGQHPLGAYNEFGPNTNANSANHAATTIYGHSAANNATGGNRLTAVGAFAGENNTTNNANTTGNHNSFFGHAAGRYNTEGYMNSFFGDGSGHYNTTGDGNSAFGHGALSRMITGNYCTALGALAGQYNETGSDNITIGLRTLADIGWNPNQVFRDNSNNVAIGNHIGILAEGDGDGLVLIGHEVGMHYGGGDYNTLIGIGAGKWSGGHRNIVIGAWSGNKNVGDNNIFIGADMNPSNVETTYTNHLFIGNTTNKEFLVGDMAAGKLGINTNTPQNALDVCGKIRSNEMICETPGWCDYVFYKNYKLPTLTQEAQHIEEKGHLIGFQSEAEMNGEIHIADVTKRQQVKIEEIMLHLIQMEKENTKIHEHLKQLKAENTQLKKEMKTLQKS